MDNEEVYRKFAELQRLLGDKSTCNPGLVTLLEDFISAVAPGLGDKISASSGAGLRPFCCYARADVLPPLPSIWQSQMDDALRQEEPSNLFDTKIPNVTRKDLLGLRPGSMISDNIVEAYTSLIPLSGDCLIATPRLLSWTTPGKIDRRFSWEGLSEVRHALIPIYHGRHWTFAHLIKKKTDEGEQWGLEYYDSILTNKYPPPFLKWLQKTFDAKGKLKVINGYNNPQQLTDGSGCGLFMLMGIRLIASGAKHLSQDEANIIMPNFRARVLAELLVGHLDPLPCEEIPASNIDPILIDKSPSHPQNEGNLDLVPSIEHGSKEQPQSSPSISSKNATRTHSRTFSIEQVHEIGTTFASQGAILEVLKNGVIAVRHNQRVHSLQTQDPEPDSHLASLWKNVVSGNSHPLMTRYLRYRYSLIFMRVRDELGGKRGKRSKNSREVMIKRLCIEDQGDKLKGWKAAMVQARLASIWVALAGMFRDTLGDDSCVVLAAVPESTSQIEAMTADAQKAYLDFIKSRVEEPGSSIVSTLRAASALYFMVIKGTLPHHLLHIEMPTGFPFLEAVSTEASPLEIHS